MDTLRHHYSDDIIITFGGEINSGQCQSKLYHRKKIFAAIFRLVANKGLIRSVLSMCADC